MTPGHEIDASRAGFLVVDAKVNREPDLYVVTTDGMTFGKEELRIAVAGVSSAKGVHDTHLVRQDMSELV